LYSTVKLPKEIKLDMDINQGIIKKILKIKLEKDKELSELPSEITIGGRDSTDIDDLVKHLEVGKKYKNKIRKLFEEFDKNELKKVYVFYYYGRSFTDGSMSPTTSFNDFMDDHKDDTYDEIIEKLTGVQYYNLKQCWEIAHSNFEEHEKNAPIEKEIFDKRLQSYKKPDGYEFFKFSKKENKKSTNSIFKEVFDDFNINKTKDINIAKKLLQKIIYETNGSVVVDFLGNENFDHLDYIESDNDMLKLYWKYSNGNNKFLLPPHNKRVDIAFEKLELIKYSDINVGIVLKGFYRDKNEIKQYYHNKEKIKKMYEFYEVKWSLFYNELNFDKRQRGALENFQVTFLPWRYYNILILPKENLPSVGDTTKILILKNLFDIENSLTNNFHKFNINFEDDEDFITMYGNRFRKTIEKLLKFILLASKIMFKDNYEKDMIGNLLEQIKEELKKEKNHLNYYDNDSLKTIIEKIENDNLLNNLNLCSHDNVKHKIDRNIIDDIFSDIQEIIKLSYRYFKLKV